MLISLDGVRPRLAPDVFIAPGAMVIGDVEMGAGSSLWFHSVARGDGFPIRIGERVNIQDGTVVHVTSGRFSTVVGDDVTIGHRAIIHGCQIARRCLIGMGATIMDGVTIDEYTLVAAGALVTPGTALPSGVLVVGSPARIKRPLSEAERTLIEESAAHYASLAARYLASSAPVDEEPERG